MIIIIVEMNNNFKQNTNHHHVKHLKYSILKFFLVLLTFVYFYSLIVYSRP